MTWINQSHSVPDFPELHPLAGVESEQVRLHAQQLFLHLLVPAVLVQLQRGLVGQGL
jgi:hypothetical protein